MPNHITNRIVTSPAALATAIVNEPDRDGVLQPCFDFARIVPIDEIIPRVDVPYNVEQLVKYAVGGGITYLRDHNLAGLSDEDFELFVQFVRAYRKTGFLHGMDAARTLWGTKWNAYSFKQITEGEVTFQTAWSAPHPVIAALAQQTGADILHEWADEDTGSNVGWKKYSGGIVVDERELTGRREGYELCFRLIPDSEESYQLVGDNYEYCEA